MGEIVGTVQAITTYLQFENRSKLISESVPSTTIRYNKNLVQTGGNTYKRDLGENNCTRESRQSKLPALHILSPIPAKSPAKSRQI